MEAAYYGLLERCYSEDLRSAVTDPLFKTIGERTEYKNYIGISLLYAGILVERVHRVTEGLTDDE